MALFAFAQNVDPVGVGSSTRYATDAYPGFDNEKSIVSPSRKEPRWFSWINGPNRDNARDQFEYCQELENDGWYRKAAKHYDALVREWPTSQEAPLAQLRLAKLLAGELDDTEEAFAEYRYLVDFFSLGCDYNAAVDEMYGLAGKMREEGKTIMFFRFRNTVDVRRNFEACVLRAPGAVWAAEAMLEIGDLREEEGAYTEAVKVYENLRNLHYGSIESKLSLVREGKVRMTILKDHAYNRDRCRDTVSFLRQALEGCEKTDAAVIQSWLDEATAMLEEESYLAMKFYDSRTRTRRSAIAAYEKFLVEFPQGRHADEVRSRLEELKGSEK